MISRLEELFGPDAVEVPSPGSPWANLDGFEPEAVEIDNGHDGNVEGTVRIIAEIHAGLYDFQQILRDGNGVAGLIAVKTGNLTLIIKGGNLVIIHIQQTVNLMGQLAARHQIKGIPDYRNVVAGAHGSAGESKCLSVYFLPAAG